MRILSAGKINEEYKRIKNNMTRANTPIPPLYGLRKDHKPYNNNIEGPPVRPVCGATVSPNQRLSHLLSKILSKIWKNDTNTICINTEELMADFETWNNDMDSDDVIAASLDVKALYPSLEINFTIDKVCDMVVGSDIQYEGIDYLEVGLYLSLNIEPNPKY